MNFLSLEAFNKCFDSVFDERLEVNQNTVKFISNSNSYCVCETLFFHYSPFIYFCPASINTWWL